MITKWKCKVCEKLLSSKQTALKHIGLKHESADPSESIIKMKVQVATTEKIGNKIVPSKKAFGFFAPLKNIFNNNSMVEDFSWGLKTGKPERDNDPVAGSSRDVDGETHKTASNSEDWLDTNLDISETVAALADDDSSTFETLFPGSVSTNTARPEFVPPTLPVTNILDKTISDYPDILTLTNSEPGISTSQLEVEVSIAWMFVNLVSFSLPALAHA